MPKPVITEESSAPEQAVGELFMFPDRYWPAGVLQALAIQAEDDAIVAAAAGGPPPVQ